MAFTPVEIIALVVILFSAIKILVLLINPKAWMDFVKKFYKNPGLIKVVGFILAIVIFYYLYYISGITIVQILAVTAFIAVFVLIGIAGETDNLIRKYQDMIKKGKLWKRYWFYTLLWVILLGWGIKEIFF